MNTTNDNPESSNKRLLIEKIQALQDQQLQLFSQLQQSQKQFRELARSVWRVQEDERRKLARDLHDGLGQNLTALKHHLQMVQDQSGDLGANAGEHLQQAIDIGTTTLADTRKLSRLLRPPILDDLGLEPALQWLCRSLSKNDSTQFEVLVKGEIPDLPIEYTTLIYRVSQEGLTNILKHANASNASVLLNCQPGQITMVIDDDGDGFDPASVKRRDSDTGFGLESMRERVLLLGGRMQIESSPGQGTRLKLQLNHSEDSH